MLQITHENHVRTCDRQLCCCFNFGIYYEQFTSPGHSQTHQVQGAALQLHAMGKETDASTQSNC